MVEGYRIAMSNYGFLDSQEVASLIAYLETLTPGGLNDDAGP